MVRLKENISIMSNLEFSWGYLSLNYLWLSSCSGRLVMKGDSLFEWLWVQFTATDIWLIFFKLICFHAIVFLKNGLSPPLFLFFRIFSTSLIQLIVNKIWRWLEDSNCGSLVLEATTLPTEPQPLPKLLFFFKKWAIPGLFLFIFVLFTFQFKWQIYNSNNINWKKA